MKIAVLDDEPAAANAVKKCLKKYADEKHLNFEIDVFDSSERLLSVYDCSYDILFLDIEMDGLDGLQSAKLIREKDESPAIVFVTNMAHYALSGYSVQASDFIIKPITNEKMSMTLTRVLRKLQSNKQEDMLLVNTVSEIINISVFRVKYVEVRKNYLFYFTDDGEYKARGTMKDAENRLTDPVFFRISNCYLVNMRAVTKILKNSLLIDSAELTISRGRKEQFMLEYLRFAEIR